MIAVVLLCLFGSILLGLTVSSLGEMGNMILRFIGIISIVSGIRIAMRYKKHT